MDQKEPHVQHEGVERDDIPPVSVRNQKTERLREISRELDEIRGVHNQEGLENPETQHSSEQSYQETIERLEKGIGTPLQDTESIRQHLVDDVYDHAQAENRRFDELQFEKKSIEVTLLAESLLDDLEAHGMTLLPENRAKLVEIFTSPELPDYDRGAIKDLIHVGEVDDAALARAALDRGIADKFGMLIREQFITNELRAILLDPNADYVSDEALRCGDLEIQGLELTDPEMRSIGVEKLRDHIRAILNDPKSKMGQGMFWNVLISEEAPFVIKTARKKERPADREYQMKTVLTYPIVRDAVGREFLPRQAVLKSGKEGSYHTLQAKLELGKMASIRKHTIDIFLSGQYRKDILDSLSRPENREKLTKFLKGVERLESEHGLLIDSLGDNIFFSLDAGGNLEITIADYGCYELKYEEQSEDIAETREVFDTLKSLVEMHGNN